MQVQLTIHCLLTPDWPVPAAQPGVASVYCSIVQQTRTGAEFYIETFPELVSPSPASLAGLSWQLQLGSNAQDDEQ